ncbi:hypothetical protein TSACC_21016 [Terrimicrobium sacchariphilum]|uniref:Uncharacterized protein n=1 Tax=Terrimicrobium sacchariphilum TaxID=690879 RepID=A0A146G6R5_TERSA|nr:hypothetical protein [Terrimicrobium sacchariphilum]GAT32617.1 hypothetical protein TSACC_21016 [Terrimicrobium sacchariphilum]
MLSPRRLLPLFLLASQSLAGWASAESTKTLEVVFDQTIQSSGLEVDRTRLAPDAAGGWAAKHGSDPDKGWQRAFRFHVSDPDYLAGRYPVIDIETTFRTAPSVLFNLDASTSSGFSNLVEERMPGRNPEEWHTRKIELNDFAPTGKNDLTLSAANALSVKDVRIIGYDLDKNVNWRRVLRVGEIVGPQEGGVLLFTRGGSREFTIPLKNHARIPCSLSYTLQISSFSAPVQKEEGKLSLPAGGAENLRFTFDHAKLPLGPYEAILDIRQTDSPDKPILSRKFRLGVITDTALTKARDGEYLYGLDPANNFQHATHTPAMFTYYRLMGVDILRNPYNIDMKETVEDASRALAILASQDLQAMIMVDPPKDKDPAKRATALEKKVAFLKKLSLKHAGKGPGKYHFFELGNEPDLPFFYPNSIPDFLESFYAMYDAIKEGSKEAGLPRDATVVMNGGLSFVHDIGEKRSREFLELIDTKRIDAFGYHGHGPGIQAERMAYERIRETARQFGKDHMPFIETESGYMGTDHSTLMDQARTVVEKTAFAQSVHEPFLMYFRLVMMEGHEGGYGMTEHVIEPRPSVLSYRTMVERLRHQQFVRLLDFAGKSGAEGVNGYLFEGRNEKGAPDGRKTVLAFCERAAKYTLLVRLATPDSKVEDVKLYDMFGNTLPVEVMSGNVASFPVGPDPVYLAWTSPDGADAVDVLSPLLRANLDTPLLTSTTNPVTLSFFNPTAKPLDVQVTVAPHARVAIEATPKDSALTLPLNQPATVPVSVALGRSETPLSLPVWWRVFLDVDGTTLTPAQLSSVPDELLTKSGMSAGEFQWTPDHRINFGKIAGGFSEWRPGTAFAYIDSPTATELRCAASPDFWMTWFVNGKKLYDTTTDRVHGGGDFGSHTFTLPLHAGRNTIAVTGFSGSGGWVVDYAGPKELAIFTSGGVDPDRLTVSIQSAGQQIARTDIPFQVQGPVPPLGDIANPDQPAGWLPLEPFALLGSSELTNLWVKEPDQSRWYTGEKDLSAIVWTRQTTESLHIFLSVMDDRMTAASTSDQLPQNDAVRLVLAGADGKPVLDATGGLVNGSAASIGSKEATFAIQREESTSIARITYHITIAKSSLPSQPLRLNLSVLDNDAGYLKQTLDLGQVSQPKAGPLLNLP